MAGGARGTGESKEKPAVIRYSRCPAVDGPGKGGAAVAAKSLETESAKRQSRHGRVAAVFHVFFFKSPLA